MFLESNLVGFMNHIARERRSKTFIISLNLKLKCSRN